MSGSQHLKNIVALAEEKETEYFWVQAVELYRQALRVVGKRDFLRKGEIQERLGYAFYRAARQAESEKEFRTACVKAVENYEKAKEFFARLSEPGKRPRMLRCDAMVAYIGYWLASEVPEKKRLIDKCWRLTKEALKLFEETGNGLEYGKTYNQLSTSTIFGSWLEWDFKAREKTTGEVAEYGEQTIRFLSNLGSPHELARAYVKTASALEAFGFQFLDLDEREKCYQKALGYWLKANELSEETAMVELLNCAAMAVLESSGWEWATDKTITKFERALEYGRKTKDRFIVGVAFDWLTTHTFFRPETSEDPDEIMRLYKKALQYAEDARHQYSLISFISPIWAAPWIEAPHAEHYWKLASYETNPRKRRDLLEKAAEVAADQLGRAEDSGYPETIMWAHHVFSGILLSLAKMETTSAEKKGLLEKALGHRNESIRLIGRFGPFFYWKRGRMQTFLADIKSELADLAEDLEIKKNMLQEALLDKENSIRFGIKYAGFYETPTSIADLGGWQYGYGGLLNRLYELTSNNEHLRKAIDAYEDAAETFQKADLISSRAECCWKVAQAYDTLGAYSKAAENFDLASDNYEKAADKISQLKTFYLDHALYTQAWSEIEKARHHHRRQEYGIAKEHFEKAASIHKTLKQWSYLAPNYSAWVQVEQAEELSRKEQNEEAIQAFEQAIRLFRGAKKSLQTELSKIESSDEKQMATNLVKATRLRCEYCKARTDLEEAKILQKKGDHTTSSEKYASAAETFEKITQAAESEQEQKEIRYIASLSRAWQEMMLAEARASAELYIEASQLFEQASEHSRSETTRLLALGHSRFCKALEAGTRFADTRDKAMHSAAMQQLQSATGYYQRAGLENVAEYARATGLLFDAYVHMDNAKKEIDPEKKAKLYRMTEMVLQASADSFMKTDHPEKREFVLRLLERVKEERELAVSMTEVLHAPVIVSTTALPALTPTSEKAVGLEKFEHADIQANIITRQKEVKVGENLDLEIEFVNAGKGPALLIKVTEIIPEGFELTEKPEMYRVEDSYLNMKGKRVDPLKTEEVRLVLKPKVRGVFPLKPRILYLDENGKYRSHEPEPINITVTELGIKGWIKGER